MKEVSCENLGVVDCEFVAQGEDKKEVVTEMVSHLEEEHGLDLPDPDVILETYPDEETLIAKLAEIFAGGPDKETELIVNRLRNKLDIGTEDNDLSREQL